MEQTFDWTLNMVKKNQGQKDSKVWPRRWGSEWIFELEFGSTTGTEAMGDQILGLAVVALHHLGTIVPHRHFR